MTETEWIEKVRSPFREVESCFKALQSSGASAVLHDWSVRDRFSECFSESAYAHIPWLTKRSLTHLSSGTLVRYRCMVQDVFDPEYFEAAVWKPTHHNETGDSGQTKELVPMKFRTEPLVVEYTQEEEDQQPLLTERLPMYCVPIPGETEWAQTIRQEKAMSGQSLLQSSRKRVQAINSQDIRGEAALETMKRAREGEEEEDLQREQVKKENRMDGCNKNENIDSGTQHLEEIMKSTPIQTREQSVETHVPCIVKLYDDDIGKLRVNDLVEFVGILEVNPFIATSGPGELESQLSALEISARKPPSSLVPRLHCIQFKKSPPTFLTQPAINQDHLSSFRQSLTEALSHGPCAGDTLAAKYLMLWLVSGVFARPSDDVLVGKMSLAITQHPGGVLKERLVAFLSSVLPRFQHLELGVDLLNDQVFSPKKCHEANRLRAGRLQICSGTRILIDETSLGSGQLLAQGLRNLDALKELCSKQVVHYDFEFYQQEWKVDLPACVVSCNRTPLVSDVDCSLPLCPTDLDGAASPPVNVDLDDLRRYLDFVQNKDAKQFAISEEMCRVVENDFVQMRQKDPSLQPDDMHLLLTMARLWCVSCGLDSLSRQAWDDVCDMENQRRSRLDKGTSK